MQVGFERNFQMCTWKKSQPKILETHGNKLKTLKTRELYLHVVPWFFASIVAGCNYHQMIGLLDLGGVEVPPSVRA